MMTLESFEEASEAVGKVTQETKLVYSEYFSEQTGSIRRKLHPSGNPDGEVG